MFAAGHHLPSTSLRRVARLACQAVFLRNAQQHGLRASRATQRRTATGGGCCRKAFI